MPKLNFEKNNRNLSLAFANMGLSDLFKPGYANLYDISDYKWLHVSDIIHKIHVDIREMENVINNGKVSTTGNKNQGSDTIDVDFDKPFLYFIRDNVSGLVLVMGKVGREPAHYRLPVGAS